MAQHSTFKTQKREPSSRKNFIRSMLIIGMLFFIFGFITWLNSVLIPYLKIACQLNNFESYLVAFAFYISYLVMGIPSAWLLRISGFKKGISMGLYIMAFGAVVFVPAALLRAYGLFLLGLFIQGTGLALLQTASNPYITLLGPRESAAKRISIMGICNKIAGALAPIVLGAIALKNADVLVEQLNVMDSTEKGLVLDTLAKRVIAPYIIMTGVLASLGIVVKYSSLPEIDTDQEEETMTLAHTRKTSVLQFPHLVLGMIAMFMYVGVEVVAGDTIISYGASQHISFATAKFFTTCTLVAMVAGYLIGTATIPKYISQENAAKISAILGLSFSVFALSTQGFVSVLFIALLGLANALIFPAIWPMAIAGLGKFTKVGSSLLIMGLSGGAVIPLLYGYLADRINPQQAYWIMIPCYLFILYYATIGHKAGKK